MNGSAFFWNRSRHRPDTPPPCPRPSDVTNLCHHSANFCVAGTLGVWFGWLVEYAQHNAAVHRNRLWGRISRPAGVGPYVEPDSGQPRCLSPQSHRSLALVGHDLPGGLWSVGSGWHASRNHHATAVGPADGRSRDDAASSPAARANSDASRAPQPVARSVAPQLGLVSNDDCRLQMALGRATC